MKLKKLSSGVVASIIMASSVSFASEVNVQPIGGSEAHLKCIEKINEVKKARTLNQTNQRMYEDRTIKLGSGAYETTVDVPVDSILDTNILLTDEIKKANKEICIVIENDNENSFEVFHTKPSDWPNQECITMKTGVKKGKYTVTITDDFDKEMSTELTFGYYAPDNIEIEHNGDVDYATPMTLGAKYEGVINGGDSDVFKVNVTKDTKVKVTLDVDKVISNGSTSDDEFVVTDSKGEVIDYISGSGKGTHMATMTLKKGVNYIQLHSNNTSSEYSLTVKEVKEVKSPKLYTVADTRSYVSGTVEPGNKVYVKVGSASYKKATVSSNGYFKLTTNGKIKSGTTIKAYTMDSEGNKSNVVQTKCIDKTAPNKPTVSVKCLSDGIILSGKAEPNAIVRCTFAETGGSRETIATKDGSYKIHLSPLKSGEAVLMTAIDAAGNTSAAVKVTPVVVAAPKVNNVSNIHTKVTGTAKKGYTVYVKAGSKYYKSKVDSKGNFSVTIPKQKYKSVIKVYAKDAKGYNSKVVSKTIGYAPKKPILNPVLRTSTIVSGESSKNANITVKIGNKVYTGKTDSEGTFSIKIPKQKKGTEIKVQAKFASTGFTSYVATTKVK